MNPIYTTNRDSYRGDEGSGRFYHFKGEGPFLSVTRVVKLGIPSPYLDKWYAKVVAEYVDENWDELEFLQKNQYEDGSFVRFLKGRPVAARDEAGDFGTRVHGICEDLMLDVPFPIDLPKKIAQRVLQFQSFLNTVKPDILAVEGIVFNREHGYAGTFDIIANIPNYGTMVIDIKTGRGVYGSAAIQQTAYRHGEFIAVGTEEVPMLETDGAMILHLQATQWRLLPVETGETSWSVFLSALHTAKWIIGHEGDAVGKPALRGKG